MSELTKVTLYTDGSSRGNPGPGGYGAILVFVKADGVKVEKEITAGYKETTNNRMELMGVIEGLKALTRPCDVTVISDSKYVTDAFNQGWLDKWEKAGWKRGKEPVKNIDLWKKLLDQTGKHKVTFVWVKGHAGHDYNERCDKLATSSADGDNLLDDYVTEMLS